MRQLAMVVAGPGSTPRIAIDVAARCATPIAGIVQLATDEPFAGDLVRLGAEQLLDDRAFLSAHAIVNGVQGSARHTVGTRLLDTGADLRTLTHPAATIAASAAIGAGCLISAGVIVNVDARIGAHCVIHSAATIDHDDVLEDGVTISPGAHLAGHVTVRTGAFVGIGATVIGGLTIGRGAIIGAGAVVLRDVPDGATVAGNPARALPPKRG